MKLSTLNTTKPEGTTGKYGDVIGTIKAALKEIKPGECVKVSEMVKVLIAKHKVPRNQAYVRINNIITRTWFTKDYTKAWDKDGHTWLGRKEVGTKAPMTEKNPQYGSASK